MALISVKLAVVGTGESETDPPVVVVRIWRNRRGQTMPQKTCQTSCVGCSTRCSSEWDCLTEPELRTIDRAKISLAYAPGDSVFNQGDESTGIYCIQSGLIGLRRLDHDGNSTLIRLIHPGETIGYRSFLQNMPHCNSAEILMPSVVCFVSRCAIRTILERSAALGRRFLGHCLGDLTETEKRYMESVTWKAKTRLLHVLLVLYEKFGTETQCGEHLIELPISRQDLAGLIGTAPETMSRTIQRIEIEGLAHFDGRTVRISNLSSFREHLPYT